MALKYYQGYWKHGKHDGFGYEYYMVNPYVQNIAYIGQFKDNLREGSGVAYYPNGKVCKQGKWQLNHIKDYDLHFDEKGE